MMNVLCTLSGQLATGLLMVTVISGCSATTSAGSKHLAGTRPAEPVSLQLPIKGYNYTNRYIDHFEVDGVGGGNIDVTGPESGPGGSTCCAVYVKGTRAWKATVEWQTGACRYNERIQASGRPTFDLHRFYKKVEVDIDPKIPADPTQMEVHFYPDGNVQIALTERNSAPRLALSKDREIKGPYAQCPNNQKPAASQ